MPEANIAVNGAEIGTVTIDPLLVDAAGGPEFPYLTITTKVSLRPTEERASIPMEQPTEKFRNYSIIQASGRVLFQLEERGLVPLAKFITSPLMLRTNHGNQSFNIEVELDPYRVRSIEQHRHGDLSLKLEINWLVVKHPEGVRNNWIRSAEEIETAYTVRLSGLTG